MRQEDRDKLISAVYTATLAADDLDEILETFDGVIFGNPPLDQTNAPVHSLPDTDDGNASLDLAFAPKLLDHLARARTIQLRMGRKKNDTPDLQKLLDATPNPAIICDQTEAILAGNQLAKTDKNCLPGTLSAFCTHTASLERARRFMVRNTQGDVLIEPGYLNPQASINTCVLVKKIDTDSDIGSGDQFFFTIIDLGFDPEKSNVFQNIYDMTDTETKIAVLLASGRQIPEIAKSRKTSIATIRTHIKRIKKKTNARDIAAIVRLLCGVSAGILVSSQFSQSTTTSDETSNLPRSEHQIILRDGRKMVYLEQGNPNGHPVMLLHNMPYGSVLPTAAIWAAKRMNLRFICPYRPGIGESDPLPNLSGNALLNSVAADMYELLDELKIAKANLLGVVIGSVYALRFARLYPKRVSGLFAVTRAPIWRDEWLSQVPRRQRLIMRITKHVPQLLPLITRTLVMLYDDDKAEELTRSLCQEGEAEMLALENPETMNLLVEGNRLGLKQGAAAFRQDCFLTITDFTEEARQSKHKFHILHGASDGIVKVEQSKAFADEVPGTHLEMVEGAGHFLIYSHWERVLKAIKNSQKDK